MTKQIIVHQAHGQVKELPQSFIGRGEVKGHSFQQIGRSDRANIYEVCDTFGNKRHEVLLRRIDARFGNILYQKPIHLVLLPGAYSLYKAVKRFSVISNGSVSK